MFQTIPCPGYLDAMDRYRRHDQERGSDAGHASDNQLRLRTWPGEGMPSDDSFPSFLRRIAARASSSSSWLFRSNPTAASATLSRQS